MPVNLQPSTGNTGILKKEKSREGSRRMPTNSRPPLSHRIRASFEGKKSQDSTSTKHASFSGGSPTDPEVLRQAIDQAISGDAFQAGLASHIAKLLKPDIKTALDTIEPIVNAVLQHEILLKKTNAGVDHVLLSLESMADQEEEADSTKARLSAHGALTSHPISDRRSEELPLPISYTSMPGTGTPRSFSNQQPRPLPSRSVTYTAGKLSEISDSLDANNNKLGKLVDGITKINNLLISDERLDSLKESLEKNDTKTSVMQTQLDQLQENVRVIITRIGPDLGTNVKAINDHLAGGTPRPETAAVVSHGTGGDAELLQTISTKLEALNRNLDASTSSNNVNLGLMKEQITALQSTLDFQKETLLEIKGVSNGAEILAGIQKSNESHEAHTAILGELKERNVQPMDVSNQPALTSADMETFQTILTEVQKSNEAHEKHTAALESIKNSDINTTILAEVQKSNDSHLAHASTLESLRSLSTPPSEPTTSIDLEGLKIKIDSLIETNTAILTEVQKSNESHVSHAAALENIKVLPTPPPETIPPGESAVEILEKNMGCIIEKLDNHAAVLDEIKTKDITAQGGTTAGAFDGHFGSISSLLEAQKALLEEIKSKVIPSADLSPIISMLEAHAVTLDQIKSKGAGDSPDFSPITSMLEVHTTTLEEIKAKEAHMIDFSSVISTLETHGAVLHEIKSKDVQSSNAPAAIDMEAFETHFNSITGILAAHTTALDDIKSKDGSSNSSVLAEINIKALDKHFGSIASMLEAHTVALDEIKSKAITSSNGSAEPNTAAFDGHFNSLISKLESHTAVLDELKSRNNDSSPSSMPRRNSTGIESLEPHITAIKSALDAHMVLLDDIKSETLAKNDMDAMVVDNMLEPHIMAIKNTLNTHTAILEELKSNASSSEIGNNSLPKILKSLSSHTNLLQEIKNADVSDEILTALHELQESNSTAFETLKDSDVSDEILTALHTCNDSQEKLDRSLLELQTVMNTSTSSEQNGNKPIEGSEIQAPIAAMDLSGLETQIDAVITTLEGQNVVLREIRDVTNSGMEAHSSHTVTLDGLKNAASASNDSHTVHAAILGEIKDLATVSNESHSSHSATLGVIRDATAALSNAHTAQITTLGELREVMQTSDESHNTHRSTLGEIRDATSDLNKAHLTHTTTLGELKEAIIASNASHASHTAVLADLTSQLSPDTAAELALAPILDTSGLDTQLTNIITTLDSHTSSLGEIKDAHTSHSITLGEIKDATTVSNESHTVHATVLSDIKEAIAPVHGMNEILSTHIGLLEGLKEDSGLKHDEVRDDIKELKKIVDESSSKHEENLLKHGELIKGHGDLISDNHDGLKGAIAGLALGGIVGAAVMKAVDGEEDKKDKVFDVAERVEEPQSLTEEEKMPEEESSVLEPEAQVDEESAPESTEERLESPVEEQVVTEPEAQLESEVTGSVEEEKTASADDDSSNLEKDAEAIPTEPEVTAEIQESTPAPHSISVEQELEPEVIVEKEEPVEEQSPIEPEVPLQEAEVKEPVLAEESEIATAETEDITPALDPQQVEENVPTQEILPQDIPRSIEPEVPSESNPESDTPAINGESEIIQKSEEVEDTTSGIIEEPNPAQDTPAIEERQVHSQEPTPENDRVVESSKDEPEPEERHAVEEISSEEEIIAVEGSKKEGDGKSNGDEGQVENVVDSADSPVDEIIPVVVEEDKSTEEVTLSSQVGETHPANEALLAEEEDSTKELIPEELIEDSSITSEETHPLEIDEKLSESEEADLPTLDDEPEESLVPEVLAEITPDNLEDSIHLETEENLPEPEEVDVSNLDEAPIDSEENTVTQDPEIETPGLILESCEEVSAEHVGSPAEFKVTEPCNEEHIAKEGVDIELAVEEEPVESKIKTLETHVLEPSNEEIRTGEAESVTEPSSEDCSLELVVELETSVLELNDQGQTIESDTKGLETEDSELSNKDAPGQIAENFIGSLQEESIPEPVVETETSIPELSDQDQTPVKGEETPREIDASEHIKEEISSDPTNAIGTLRETSISEATGETKTTVLELNDRNSVLFENGGVSVEDDVSEPAVNELEDSEDITPLVKNEEWDSETDNQNRSNESLPAEITKSGVPIEELAFENQFPVPNEDANVVGAAPDKIIPESEVENENLINMPESSEEIRFAADNGEKLTSTEEQVIETFSEDLVPAKEPRSEHFINEDPEDIRTREEIAALNAQMARILAEEAEGKNSEQIMEETKKSEGNNVPAETETFPAEEPKELKVEHHAEESADLPNVQPPVESQGISEEQLEDEPVHIDATELAEERKKSVGNEQRSSEFLPEENLDKLATESTDLEEDNSFEEPKIETAENTIIPPTDELTQQGKITPNTNDGTSQAQSAEDGDLPEEKSLRISTGLEEMIPENVTIAEEPENVTLINEISPLDFESLSRYQPNVLESELIAAELPTETKMKDHQNASLSDDGSPPADIEEKESLSVQLEPGSVIGGELSVTKFESVPTKFAQGSESKDYESETVLENSLVEEVIERGPISNIDLDVEGENEEMENEILSVEHLEVIEAEPTPEDNLRDAPFVEYEESKTVHEYLDIPKELETEEMTPENPSDRVDGSETVKDNSVEDRAQELEDLAEGQSTEPSHEGISAPNGGIQHDNEPSRDEIGFVIPSPSDLVQNESIVLEKENYPVPESLLVQDTMQTGIYQNSEGILPFEKQVAQNSSIVPHEHKIEVMTDSDSREIPIIPVSEYIPEENVAIESKPVLGNHEAIAEEKYDDSPQDDTSRDQFQSKFLPGSEPQAQLSIESFSNLTVTPREEVIPLEEETIFKKENSMTEPTEDQAFEDNQSISDEVPTVLKDDKQLEDTISIYSQEVEPEGAMEAYRQEEEFLSREGSFGSGAFTGDYIDAEQLEQVLEPETTQIEAGQYSTQQPNFSNPESVSEQRHSSYVEFPINNRTYQDGNETLEPEPEPKPVTSDSDPRDAHPTHGASFSRSVTEQRYSDLEETPSATQTTYNRQHNSEQSLPELEPQTAYESPSYQQDNFSETYATQEFRVDDTKAAQDPLITPTDQTKHRDDISPAPSTSVTTKMSTETFPTYDESRRSPVSHGLNFGMPVRTSERAETIRENPKSENERPYPTYNEPIRPSGPSRLPVASQRTQDTVRKNPELKKQLSYSRYGEPPTSSRPSQGFNTGLPTRIPGSVEKPRENPEFESQRGFAKRDEPVRSSGHSQGSKFGLSTTNSPDVESQWEITEPVNRSSNVRSLLRQFEGGELSSSTIHQERFSTSLPRPAENRSFGKQLEYGEEEE
ncbi:hypothetical protein EAF04_003902 [Stromatinia cepivora]|nr:hypothetical protein EAF04_003902 [Stromatinia cepivora]